VSHDVSRKHFVAKGLGLLALAGLAPKLRAFSASGSTAKADAFVAADGRASASRSVAVQRNTAVHSQAAPKLRVEPRAVARTDSAFAPALAKPAAASGQCGDCGYRN